MPERSVVADPEQIDPSIAPRDCRQTFEHELIVRQRRAARGAGLTLNPDEAAPVELDDDDQVIVLAED
jgi:hypothetical protein